MTTLSRPSATIESLNESIGGWDDQEQLLIAEQHPHGDGGMYQRERIQAAALWACQRFTGDLVEVGCLHGSTTIRLAEVARAQGRRVLAVDPFTMGTQNVTDGLFESFTKTTEPYADVIDFMRARSDEDAVVAELRRRSLAFAFVDGLHSFNGAYGDLVTVAHAPLIVLDDTRALAGPRMALSQFLTEFTVERAEGVEVLAKDYWRETYILQEASNG